MYVCVCVSDRKQLESDGNGCIVMGNWPVDWLCAADKYPSTEWRRQTMHALINIDWSIEKDTQSLSRHK